MSNYMRPTAVILIEDSYLLRATSSTWKTFFGPSLTLARDVYIVFSLPR